MGSGVGLGSGIAVGSGRGVSVARPAHPETRVRMKRIKSSFRNFIPWDFTSKRNLRFFLWVDRSPFMMNGVIP